MKNQHSAKQIKSWLEVVKDPEIPVLSLNDLGVITDIQIDANNKVTVEMTPTFAGCPAMDVMRSDVEEVLKERGIQNFEVRISFDVQWNSNMISEKGRKALKSFGLAPPPEHDLIIDIDIIEHAQCPHCNSEDTEMKTPFGPTLCRSMHYCNNCLNAFEQFKPI